MKHRNQLTGKTKALDKAHKKMKNLGIERFVFIPLLGLDHLAPTKKLRRFYEWKLFVIFRPTLNTCGQQGVHDTIKIID